jgi:nicotinamidase-related amidase
MMHHQIPDNAAVLTLDLQMGIFELIPGAEAVLEGAGRVARWARDGKLPLIHVGLGFAPGYPEIPEGSAFGERIKPGKLFLKGSPSAEVHPRLLQPGDLVVSKQRVSAFSHNELQLILRARGVETLILMGIATSGIVLSTLRQAFDLDYRCVVVSDACADRDPEVHRVLMEKVFPAQAAVIASRQLTAGTADTDDTAGS